MSIKVSQYSSVATVISCNRCFSYQNNTRFGIHNHTLRNDLIRLPAIRCEFREMNAKYQMHLRLRELASPPDTPEYPPIEISEATLYVHQFAVSQII